MRASLSNRGWAVAAAVLMCLGSYLIARPDSQSAPAPGHVAPAGLIDRLRSPALADRRSATAEAARVRVAPADAIRPLTHALADDDLVVRAQAAVALARTGPAALEPLTAALAGANLNARRAAADGLGQMHSAAAAAIPLLVVALGDPDEAVSVNSSRALSKMGSTAAAALIGELRDGRPRARARAAEALAGLDPPPPAAVGPLVTALDDENEAVRLAVCNALPAFGETAVRPLAAALATPTAHVRQLSAQALASLAPYSVAAIEPLGIALTDRELLVRQAAAFALSAMGPAARPAVTPLQAALHDADALVRRTAAEALGRIGRDARVAVTALLDLQADNAPAVREAATRALVHIVLDGPNAQARRIPTALYYEPVPG